VIRVLGLCAGFGGLELGLRVALGRSVRAVCLVERDARAAASLVARMEEETLAPAPVWDDLRAFDGRPWRGRVDLVAAGYPCQPFSQAGKRLGEDDPRHLWPEVRRILEETEAPFAFFENVRGHVRLGLDRVLLDLADLGFDAEWTVLGARDVGAPHRRDRLWILAWRRDLGPERISDADGGLLRDLAERGPGAAQAADERDAEPRDLGEERRSADGGLVADASGDDRRTGERGAEEGTRPDELGRRRPSGGGDPLAHADRRRLEGERLKERGGLERESGRLLDGRDPHGGLVWPPGPLDREAWGRIDADAQPAIRGVADGSSSRLDDRDRLRMLGNGVVPLAAAHAFRTLSRRAGLALPPLDSEG
jgi:DNA (cytosine-5)-methyltransferase 1